MAALTTAQTEALMTATDRRPAGSAATRRKLIEKGYLTEKEKPTPKAADYAARLEKLISDRAWEKMTSGEIIYTLGYRDDGDYALAKDYVRHGAPHLTKEVYENCWNLKDEDVKEGMDVATARKFAPYYDSLTDYPKVLMAPDAIIDTMKTANPWGERRPGYLSGFADHLQNMSPDIIIEAMRLAASHMDFTDFSRFYALLDQAKRIELYEDETQPLTLRVAMGNVIGDDSLFCEENDFTMLRHCMNLLHLKYTDRMLNHVLDMTKHGELPPIHATEGRLSQATIRRIMASDSPAAASLKYDIEDAAETLKSCRENIRRVRSLYDIPEDVLAETGEE